MKTIIDKQTGLELYATTLDWIDSETEIGVDELRTEWFLKPKFNFETRTYFEGATQEEIDEYNQTLE
jgi:hypothetical protein